MMWFEQNKVDPSARSIIYSNFPKHYRWFNHRWSRRVGGGAVGTVGRMYTVPPSDRERFYLRILLHHVAGAQSFEDMRTVDGVIYDTFLEAALARGLIEDDSEWNDCLKEASLTDRPQQMRVLFVNILILCRPTNPQRLFDTHKNALSEDFLYARRQRMPGARYTQDVTDQALHDIQNRLRKQGFLLADFKMRTPPARVPEEANDKYREIREELNADRELLAETAASCLRRATIEQLDVLMLLFNSYTRIHLIWLNVVQRIPNC
jgi:hypothetical protein